MEKKEIIKILKHLNRWPIQYPMPPPKLSSQHRELLSKLAASNADKLQVRVLVNNFLAKKQENYL